MSEYSAYRPKNPSNSITRKTLKEYETTEAKERKRALLYLTHNFLRDAGLHDTADVLSQEAQLANSYEVCDNVDLDIVLQDYQSYYYAKFSKAPKIIKKVASDCAAGDEGKPSSGRRRSKPASTVSPPPLKPALQKESSTTSQNPDTSDEFMIGITNLSRPQNTPVNGSGDKTTCQLPPPRPALCEFAGYSPEWREMADLIVREIVPRNLGGGWGDCVGVEASVELLKEAVVYPLRYPALFTGLLAPWKGILLYGPPGTGKTLLAKALAGETASTFINLTISTFVSKWRGDSEKMLKVLFDVARLYAPTTIFIDELDAIASKYEDLQHDASRRFKSELLVQLDGLLSGNDHIFVLATTNLPWNLNSAILRRFEKRILLNIPTKDARAELFRHFFDLHSNDLSRDDFKNMAEMTDNFSAADIKMVCKEVLMSTVREKLALMSKTRRNDADFRNLRPPTIDDVHLAVSKIHPATSPETVKCYEEWSQKYGSL